MEESQKELDKALSGIHSRFVLINHLFNTKEALDKSYYTAMNENTKKMIDQLSELSVIVAKRFQVIFVDWPKT
jgi:hypothetical protein